ncbi:hypothetical protein N658DRAFT_198310 [Parathielavia hyrcaniae]|uniref:Secreted protein n=1 Tax=Parathielavia hyrcaniae TaxID=113614 RepID=A0AAN6Q7J2_9PEZI|nr:hypothetical protein N658DRAFT_198310 [Parathielavia hyrcaniae]
MRRSLSRNVVLAIGLAATRLCVFPPNSRQKHGVHFFILLLDVPAKPVSSFSQQRWATPTDLLVSPASQQSLTRFIMTGWQRLKHRIEGQRQEAASRVARGAGRWPSSLGYGEAS